MLEAQLINSNRQSEMKITELQVQLNTSIQILQADKDSFNKSLQLVQSQLDNSNEQFGGQQTQLNSSNQLLLRLQDQLSATTGILQQSLSEQENRLENIQLIVEELEQVRLGGVNNPASSLMLASVMKTHPSSSLRSMYAEYSFVFSNYTFRVETG